MAATIHGVDAALRAVGAAMDDELRGAVEWASSGVAGLARATHAYTDRTGLLTKSTKGLHAVGSAMAGTLRGGALAETPYASYVEASEYAFMDPAWRQLEPIFEQAVDQALLRAWER